MRTLSAIHDPTYNPKAQLSGLDQFFLQFIRDKRDLPFVYLTINISLTLIPVGILLFTPLLTGWMWWAAAALYFYLNNFVFKGPFGLMLHCTSHRKFFKKKYDVLNHYLPWVVGPFFGQTPETYYSHHIGMHHPENNLEDDLSSTMPYQRDSLRDFGKYFVRFFFLGIYELLSYFQRKNRNKLWRKTVRGEILFILFCVALCFVSVKATIWVFVLPFLISRVIMMMGNWAQHTFICPNEPDNLYKSSITCINVKYNHKCWNDGYHISHHIKPAMHWTEHPNHFLQNREEYAKNDAIVFEGMEFLGVFINVMRKRYDKLAQHYVRLDNSYQTDEEVIAMLRERTRKFDLNAEKAVPAFA